MSVESKYLYYSVLADFGRGHAMYRLSSGENVKVTHIFTNEEYTKTSKYRNLVLVGMSGLFLYNSFMGGAREICYYKPHR